MKIFKKLKLFFRRNRANDVASPKEVQVNEMPDLSTKTEEKRTKMSIPSQVKLVITGSVGAGKTTAIKNVSEIAPVTTESKPSDGVALMKDSTTTSMDYGSYNHHQKSKINIYGTPGQRRFSFMSSILTKGASGLIILINNKQKEPLKDLAFYLQANEDFLQKKPAIIGVTHCDEKKEDISKYSKFLKSQGIKWSVVSIDARKSKDVKNLVNLLLMHHFHFVKTPSMNKNFQPS
jgi:small GTP-binding protein